MCNIVRSASFLDVVAAPKNSNLKNRREQQRAAEENSGEQQRKVENSWRTVGEQLSKAEKSTNGVVRDDPAVFKTTDNFRLKPMVSFFYTANINKNNLHSQCTNRKLRIAKRNYKRNCKRDWREHDPTYNTAHEEDHGCLKTAFMYSCTPSVVLEVGLIGGCPCPPPSVLILLIRSCSISFKSWFQDEYLSKRRTHRRKKTKQVRV